MALINCPECGKAISDFAQSCPHCGFPITKIKNNHTEDISDDLNIAKNKDSACLLFCKPKKKRKLQIILISFLSLLLVAITALVIFSRFGEYSYKRNGIYGFGVPIKWEMNKAEVQSLELGANDSDADDPYLSYDGIEFSDEIVGDLFIRFNDKDSDTIKTIQFVIQDSKTPEDISKIISEKLGQPIHKDNFNNKKMDSPKHMWLYGKNQYIILEKVNEFDQLRINWEVANLETIEKAKVLLSTIEKSDEFNETFNSLLYRAKYDGGSITDVIQDLNVENYKINETNKEFNFLAETGNYDYTYDSVDFVEDIKLFGFNVKTKYHCYNPYDDYYPDFIGKIEYITYNFVDDISQEQAEKISDLIDIYTGKDNNEDSDDYLPIRINYDVNYPQKISCEINDKYYLINPEYGYDESTEEIEEYYDCDAKILHLNVDETKHRINIRSDAAEDCWKLTKQGVKNRLKSPRSATFSNEYLIERTGNIYEVTSYVDAQNSFGAIIRTYFVVTINRNGRNYSITDIIFSK